MTLTVYDIAGKEVARLVEGYVNAGWHSVTWDASHLVSGVYICRMKAGEFSGMIRMALIK